MTQHITKKEQHAIRAQRERIIHYSGVPIKGQWMWALCGRGPREGGRAFHTRTRKCVTCLRCLHAMRAREI